MAVARKLIGRIRAAFRKGELYQLNYQNLVTEVSEVTEYSGASGTEVFEVSEHSGATKTEVLEVSEVGKVSFCP